MPIPNLIGVILTPFIFVDFIENIDLQYFTLWLSLVIADGWKMLVNTGKSGIGEQKSNGGTTNV
jgi:hypothetical protein